MTPEQLRDEVAAGFLGAKVGRTGLTAGIMLDRLYQGAQVSAAREVALTAAVEALAKGQGADPAAVKAAVEEALAGYSLTLTKAEGATS